MDSEKIERGIFMISLEVLKFKWDRIVVVLDQCSHQERKLLVELLYLGITPMFYAASINEHNLLTYFIYECNASFNKPCYIADQEITPFWVAVWNNSYEAAERLVQYGVNINTKSQFAATALLKCLSEKNIKLIKLILKKEPNLNICSSRGHTPLMLAVFNQVITKEILSKTKHSLKAIDTRGNTALHYAARYKNKTILKLLVSEGLSFSTKNDEGKTARDIEKESLEDYSLVPVFRSTSRLGKRKYRASIKDHMVPNSGEESLSDSIVALTYTETREICRLCKHLKKIH